MSQKMEIASGMQGSDGGTLGADKTLRNKRIAIFFAIAVSIGIFAGVSTDLQRSSSSNGFCWSCVNAPSRSWSWWFGWGNCDCYTGWYGDCCDSANPEISDIASEDVSLSDVTLWRALQTIASWGATIMFWGSYDGEFWLDMIQIKTLTNYPSYFCEYNDDAVSLQKDLDGGGSVDYPCGYMDGPGVDSKTFSEYNTVRHLVDNTPDWQASGVIVDRGNELGLLRLNEAFYPECDGASDGSPMGGSDCGIGLGASLEDHAFVRPYLDYLLGTAGGNAVSGGSAISSDSTSPGHKEEFVSDSNRGEIDSRTSLGCASGNTWDRECLVASATDYLSDKTSITSKLSTGAWTSKILHKLTLGMDITDEWADTFVTYQGTALKIVVLPDWVLSVFGFVFDLDQIQADKASYVSEYADALEALQTAGAFDGCANCQHMDQGGLNLVATNVLDSNIFAGGLSVPSVIQTALGAYYKWGGDESGDAPLSSLDYTSRAKLVMESVRYNPAVLGFPSIYGGTDVNSPAGQQIHDAGHYSSTYGAYNERITPAVAMAGFDYCENAADGAAKDANGCSSYDDVNTFNVNRYADLNTWHAKSMDWADKAIHESDPVYNRVCPAKDLAYTMVIAWLEAQNPDAWSVTGGAANLEELGGPDWWTSFTMTKN